MTAASLPAAMVDRLARVLYLEHTLDKDAERRWSVGGDYVNKEPWQRQARRVLANVLGMRQERDCPGEDCRRHPQGQHTHSRLVSDWVEVTPEGAKP